MKSRFLPALTWLFIALATFGAKVVYADMNAQTGAMSQQATCNDSYWIEDAVCPDKIRSIRGNAAYGESTEMGGQATQMVGTFCRTDGDDWNFNDPICHPRLTQGKAAYGEPVRTTPTLPAYCTVDGNDWNFNDPNCPR